jgi:hypothetical protein
MKSLLLKDVDNIDDNKLNIIKISTLKKELLEKEDFYKDKIKFNLDEYLLLSEYAIIFIEKEANVSIEIPAINRLCLILISLIDDKKEYYMLPILGNIFSISREYKNIRHYLIGYDYRDILSGDYSEEIKNYYGISIISFDKKIYYFVIHI